MPIPNKAKSGSGAPESEGGIRSGRARVPENEPSPDASQVPATIAMLGAAVLAGVIFVIIRFWS
jgi:hypothetical protein